MLQRGLLIRFVLESQVKGVLTQLCLACLKCQLLSVALNSPANLRHLCRARLLWDYRGLNESFGIGQGMFGSVSLPGRVVS